MLKFARHLVNIVKSKLRDHVTERKRSPLWHKVEHAFRRAHPTCAGCGTRVRIQVHHMHPFHLFPERELDPTNLISLCMGPNECHLKIGHGDNFRAWNPNVATDAAAALADPSKRMTIEAEAKKNRILTRS